MHYIFLCTYHLNEFGVQTTRHLCPCALCGFGKRDFPVGNSRRSCRSNVALLEVYSVPPRALSIWSVLGSKLISCSGAAHMYSRPQFLSTAAALGVPDPKSLHYYNTFSVQILETTIITHSNSQLCTSIGHFELVAKVL